jgi:predicted DNA binding protein
MEVWKLKTIAKQFNMSESAISEVVRGTTWGWES